MSAPIRCIADLPDQHPAWLWPHWIPRGALTLLVGEPGAGKSLLTLDLAARVTAASAWPDGAPAAAPADVLLLSAEDSIAGAVRTRLMAHGADLRRVHYLHAGDWSRSHPAPGPTEGLAANGPIFERTAFGYQPTLIAHAPARDAHHLTAALDALPDCRLVVLDPIVAYLEKLGGDSPAAVRALLAPLAILAERSGAAVIAVAHRTPPLRSASAGQQWAMHALADMARAIYLVDRLPDDRSRRALLPVKNNLAASTSALAFDVVDAPGGPAGGAILQWSANPVPLAPGEIPHLDAATTASAPRIRQLDRAIAWLEGALAAGPVLSGELVERAQKVGISERSLRRARAQLGVVVTHDVKHGGRWRCVLPNQVAPAEQGGLEFPAAALAPLAALPRADEGPTTAFSSAPLPIIKANSPPHLAAG